MWFITAFYKFKTIPDLKNFETKLKQEAKKLGIEGLLILAKEGVNCTKIILRVGSILSASASKRKFFLKTQPVTPDLFAVLKLSNVRKSSPSAPLIFPRKIKATIITLRQLNGTKFLKKKKTWFC
jgi:hypothetical protein